jgi:hypothetical protein
MRSHLGAGRDPRHAPAAQRAAELCLLAPATAVERRRVLSMAVALVLYTLCLLTLVMFGPAQPSSADRAAVSVTNPAPDMSIVVVPYGAARREDPARDPAMGNGATCRRREQTPLSPWARPSAAARPVCRQDARSGRD